MPPALLCILDFGLTLYGQTDGYWSGNYSEVNEISPSFAQYLAIHPLAFAASGLLWILIFSVIISLLPEFLALSASVAVVMGHMVGSASWFAYRFQNYQACNALFLVTAIVLVLAFKRGQSENGSAAFNWQCTGLPNWIRWTIVVLLMVVPIWWFLVLH